MFKLAPWPWTAAALLVIGLVVDLRAWNWAWGQVGPAVREHFFLLLFAVPAVLLVVAPLLLQRWAVRRAVRAGAVVTGPRWPWLLSYPGVGIAAASVAVVGLLALLWMMNVAGGADRGDRPKLQIEAIKYGLGLFAAGGAVAALLLALRRQRHLELAQAHTELDASERRFTDLYTKAVEQLGSGEAAVRLGGLYALERAAQNDVEQRQTIVNVLCAYLRMPYAYPGEGREARLELQVRLTAQWIISTHVACPGPAIPELLRFFRPDRRERFWPHLDLDLTGATLVDWVVREGQLGRAQFDDAVFFGTADFSGVTFSGEARFGAAAFRGAARFDRAIFYGDVRFGDATFDSRPAFGGAGAEPREDREDVWPAGWCLEPGGSLAEVLDVGHHHRERDRDG
ncbi:pentapeptide repeat-containing protein [Actinoplanes sp. CA-054009]